MAKIHLSIRANSPETQFPKDKKVEQKLKKDIILQFNQGPTSLRQNIIRHDPNRAKDPEYENKEEHSMKTPSPPHKKKS